MKQILVRSKRHGDLFTMVDDEDYDWLNQYNWNYSFRSRGSMYVKTCITYQKIYVNLIMHRMILGYPENKIIDHKDGNTFNNQRSNLRICTHEQNNANRINRRNSTSKYKGVIWCKRDKKWIARFENKGKRCNVGYFDNEIDAAKAYDLKSIEVHGEFAKLNLALENK